MRLRGVRARIRCRRMQNLLAEDNPTNENVARKLLHRLGHRCSVAHNGSEVLQALRGEAHFDCILMDIQMPEMDGIEAARRIREEFPEASRPPIIAVTANAFESDRVACFDAGMIGFLTKPLRLAVLETALDDLVREQVPSASGPPRGDIDFEQFDSIIDGGDEEAIEIFDDFCAATVNMLDEMRGHAERSEIESFGDLAHQLKGSLATFGLAALSQKLGTFEKVAQSGSLAGLESGWKESLQGAFAKAVGELRERF